MTTIDKLKGILFRQYLAEQVGIDVGTATDNAEQAIIAWALEIVGSDRDNPLYYSVATHAYTFDSGYNAAKAEIRAKFTGGTE